MANWRWHPRRWLQFSLRNLLILVLLCALIACLTGLQIRQAERQAKAIQAVEDSGGSVIYDFQSEHGILVNANAKPHAPQWLRSALGDDLFQNVTQVSLSGARATDDTLRRLRDLPKIRVLTIFDTSQAGTRPTAITDEGLRHVNGLSSLEQLWIVGNERLTDAGIGRLAGLANLRVLRLSGCPKLTGDCLIVTRRMPRLSTLDLTGSQVSDERLALIGEHGNLAELALNGTLITDAGLAYLAKLHRLQSLLLMNTHITDAGLPHLARLKSLRELQLGGTDLHEPAVEELRRALPDCQVYW